MTEKLESYGLGGVDCPKCGNTGQLLYADEFGNLRTRECECMDKRRSMRALRESGLSDMLDHYTLESYQTPDRKRLELKQAAVDFVCAPEGWFYIDGQSGSGKTHLCTAICGELIKRGKRVSYMLWRDESVKLKGGITDREWYEQRIEKLKRVPVLYIDDFWKAKRVDGKVRVTDGDVNLAFEILNYRYNDRRLRTIISTELRLDEIISIDEAIGGRIYERARGFVKAAPNENWRLR